MIKVITYGTFDLLHTGHLNILKRAKELGDYLVVGVTSESYDQSRGKLNVSQTLSQRMENVRKTGLADEIIVEERFGQKIEDIQRHKIDRFVIGSDWTNKFDYLKDYCEVIYLPRTQGISSTELRNEKGIINIGMVGYGRIAGRFIKEARFVSGIDIRSVFGLSEKRLTEFVKKYERTDFYTNWDNFINAVDAVYIASPHFTHYDYAKRAIMAGKHVLCEKPLTLKKEQAEELFALAKKKKVILYEAIKTAYAPCFAQLVGVAKSGLIGQIKNITATFTKQIADKTLREYNKEYGGGAFNELASYPLLAIIKMLGYDYKKLNFITTIDKETDVDIYTQAHFIYPTATATATTGIGVKQEGEMIIAGTRGYIYVPAPWWKTEFFEVRFEDSSYNIKHFTKFDGDGLRYEIADFVTSIHQGQKSYKYRDDESIAISAIIEAYDNSRQSKTNIDFI